MAREGGEMRQLTIGDIMAIIGGVLLVAMFIYQPLENRHNGKINVPSGGVIVVEYNGHEYLHFTSRGIVHNPDCKCMKKGE